MKKTIAISILLVILLSLMGSCSFVKKLTRPSSTGSSSSAADSGNTSENSKKKLTGKIKPSDIITLGDAESVAGIEMKANVLDETDSEGIDETLYIATDSSIWLSITVKVKQNAESLIIETKSVHKSDIQIEGLWDWTCVADNWDETTKTLYLVYDDCYIEIILSAGDNTAAWKTAKILELANTARERFEDIIDTAK